MNFGEKIIPVSNLKANASKIIEDTFKNNQTYVITQNGYAKLVLIGIQEYDRMLKELSDLTALLSSKQTQKKQKFRKTKNKSSKLG